MPYTPAIGDHVTIPARRGKCGTAAVLRVGSCGWPQCKHGDRCVLVAPDDGSPTLNFGIADLDSLEF